MESLPHALVVHHAPFVVEAVSMVLSMEGFAVHPAVTYTDAKTLLKALGDGIKVVVAHGDMPTEPLPGTLLRMARATQPKAALVVLSGRSRKDIEPLPSGAVLLPEPFDRAELLAALATAAV